MDAKAIIAGQLSAYGYLPDIAGAEAFNKSVKSIIDSREKKRGILVIGNVGCGKTTFARAAAKILFGAQTDYKFVECGVETEMDRWFDSNGSMNELVNGYVVLDDIGSEEVDIEYGKRTDRIGQFMTAYHRIWGKINNPLPLIVTTNLSLEKLAMRYGGRFLDRLTEITVVLNMPGGSKRKMIVV